MYIIYIYIICCKDLYKDDPRETARGGIAQMKADCKEYSTCQKQSSLCYRVTSDAWFRHDGLSGSSGCLTVWQALTGHMTTLHCEDQQSERSAAFSNRLRSLHLLSLSLFDSSGYIRNHPYILYILQQLIPAISGATPKLDCPASSVASLVTAIRQRKARLLKTYSW